LAEDLKRIPEVGDRRNFSYKPQPSPAGTIADIPERIWHAHTGWLFARDRINAARFTPDLLADRDIERPAASSHCEPPSACSPRQSSAG